MNFNETVMQFVGNKQLQWFGHMKRMDEDILPMRSLEWVPNVKKRRGRPKKTWIGGNYGFDEGQVAAGWCLGG